MGRDAVDTPWLHNATAWWCATVAGKRVYLDKDYQVACRKLKQIRARQKREGTIARDWLSEPFCALADEFQADVKARRKPGTYTAYRYDLLHALRILGKSLRVGDIRKFHLAKIEQELTKTGCSPTTIHSTITTVQGVLGWAVRQQYLDFNWLAGYDWRSAGKAGPPRHAIWTHPWFLRYPLGEAV
jgi:Phage integrase, N-terminal SAM-like domain